MPSGCTVRGDFRRSLCNFFATSLTTFFTTMAHSFHRAAELGKVFSTKPNSVDSPGRAPLALSKFEEWPPIAALPIRSS